MIYKKLKTLFCLEFNSLYHYIFLIRKIVKFFSFSKEIYFGSFERKKTRLNWF
jgi:hypothetical protein